MMNKFTKSRANTYMINITVWIMCMCREREREREFLLHAHIAQNNNFLVFIYF